MARIVWPDHVLAQLDDIAAYIKQYDPAAAAGTASRLLALGESLADFPRRGRPVSRGERVMTNVWPYRMHYRVDGDVVTIVRIHHGARRPLP